MSEEEKKVEETQEEQPQEISKVANYYLVAMTLGVGGLLVVMATYYLSRPDKGLFSKIIVNTFQDDISSDAGKFLYLGFFLLITLSSYYINMISDEIFLKETKESHYFEGFYKTSIYMALLYFIFSGEKLFKTSKIYFYILTPILAFLHPLFEKLTKSKDGYNTIKLTGQTMHYKNPKMWIVGVVLSLSLLFALSNRNYENATGLFGSTKYLMIFVSALVYLLYGTFKERRVTYWFYTYLMNILINPNYSIVNTIMNSITTSYLLHGMRKTDFDIYKRDTA